MEILTRSRLRRGIGLVMLALGTLLLVQMYVMGKPPKFGSYSIATIFAIFFILRGALYIRMSRNQPTQPG